MDVRSVVIAPERDLTVGFLGLTTTVVDVRLSFAGQGGVPPITP